MGVDRQVHRAHGDKYGWGARQWFNKAHERRYMIRLGHKFERREATAFMRDALEEYEFYLGVDAREDEDFMWVDEEAAAQDALDLRYAAWDWEYARMDADMTELEQTYPIALLMRAGWCGTWSQSEEWAA